MLQNTIIHYGHLVSAANEVVYSEWELGRRRLFQNSEFLHRVYPSDEKTPGQNIVVIAR